MFVPATPYVGADVAKDTIAFCGLTAATTKNTLASLEAYLRALPDASHLVCEATGRHHHLLQRCCAKVEVPLSVINPAHIRAFARSHGKLEKTDDLDARLLRQFGQERQPPASAPPDPCWQPLLDLLMLRSALVADIADYRRRSMLLSAESARELRRVIQTLKTRQRAVEARMERWLETCASAEIEDQVQTLCLVKGVGILSALQLVAYLPELGRCNRRQIAKLAGLAPLPWDSGQMSGIRRIQHGRAPARRVLYQCAVVAARWNETLHPHYKQLRARGKCSKSAYCAIARKLVVLFNSLLRPAHAPKS